MAAKDGMFYAAKGKPDPVVKPGEFVFSAVGLDHGHIYGMTSGLLDAGATLKYVYDPDPQKVEAYRKAYPQAIAAESEEQVLADPETKLVAGACVTSERAALGIRVMQAGKDYFTDKAPLTTLEQLEENESGTIDVTGDDAAAAAATKAREDYAKMQYYEMFRDGKNVYTEHFQTEANETDPNLAPGTTKIK